MLVDGVVDATASFGSADKSPSDWVIELAGGWAPGGSQGYITNVTYGWFESVPVKNLHFSNLNVQHVGWGMGRDDVTDFQAVSYLTTAAVHFKYAINCSLEAVSVQHVGGFGVWIEEGSQNVRRCSVCRGIMVHTAFFAHVQTHTCVLYTCTHAHAHA